MGKGEGADDGEYWKRNFHPQHNDIADFQKFKRLFAEDKVIPEYLWKKFAQFIGGDPDKQPERLKNRLLSEQDMHRLAFLSKKFEEEEAKLRPVQAPAQRKPLSPGGADEPEVTP